MEETSLFTTKVPISKHITSGDKQGNLYIYSSKPFNELIESLNGLFSFVLYHEKNATFPTLSKFKASGVMCGLTAYINMLHTDTDDILKTWGAVVYTDKNTCTTLLKSFPFDKYPKLIIAVAAWPFYANDDGSLESSILRCMRYHAMELAPSKPVCIRDADTIFHHAIEYNRIYKRYTDELHALIRNWEVEFISAWKGAYAHHTKNGYDQIILGTSKDYTEPWHSDIPYPLPINDTAMKKYKLDKFFIKSHKYIRFNAGNGVYAAFVNIGADKSAFPKLWSQCIDFLLQRYYMINSPHNNRLICDYFSEDIVGNTHGKDEKLLMFVVLRNALKYIQIMYIDYVLFNEDDMEIKVDIDPQYPKQLLKHNLIRPGYVNTALLHGRKQERVMKTFKRKYAKIRDRYNKFMSQTNPKIFYKKIFGTCKNKKRNNIADKFFLKRAVPIAHKKVYTIKCGKSSL
jgi:hypothetical protein